MAMVGNDLGDAMKTAVDAQPARTSGETIAAYRTRIFRAMGSSIVAYIAAHAEVTAYVTEADAGLQVSTAPATPTAVNPALGAGVALARKGTVA